MSNSGEVVSVNLSEQKGTVKHPVAEIRIEPRGVAGDAHAGLWHRQVSLLSEEAIRTFAAQLGRALGPGEFAENVTTRGLDLQRVAPLDRLKAGAAELEVTQIGKECHGEGCAIFREVGKCVMPREGVFARVLRGGAVRPGDRVEHFPRALQIRILTLSDRAYAGEYEDRSGPRLKELLGAFFEGKRWHLALTTAVLPDDPARLRAELLQARQAEADVVFTTGGTGAGPRDITPDVVAPLCEKLLPGIMEHIRLKFGAQKPAALLSRSVAGVMGRTLVFTLPGSVRAVEEYLGEIRNVLEHLIYTVHGIDRH
jgi:molybdenum cofactor synthesis domain-containing protein